MSDDLRQALDLPPCDQVGFVVRDLDASIARYEPLFGPFTSPMEVEVPEADFRGRKADCTMKIAFGKSGDLEIELIELTAGESVHSEFIDAGREGMHHLRFWVDDIQPMLARAKAIGYEPVWLKQWDETTAFAYLERPGDPLLIEFLQMPPDGPAVNS